MTTEWNRRKAQAALASTYAIVRPRASRPVGWEVVWREGCIIHVDVLDAAAHDSVAARDEAADRLRDRLIVMPGEKVPTARHPMEGATLADFGFGKTLRAVPR